MIKIHLEKYPHLFFSLIFSFNFSFSALIDLFMVFMTPSSAKEGGGGPFSRAWPVRSFSNPCHTSFLKLSTLKNIIKIFDKCLIQLWRVFKIHQVRLVYDRTSLWQDRIIKGFFSVFSYVTFLVILQLCKTETLLLSHSINCVKQKTIA